MTPQVLAALVLHDLQHRIALLEAENDGLKGAVKALEMSILIPSSGYAASLEHSTNLLHHPIPRGGNSGKNP